MLSLNFKKSGSPHLNNSEEDEIVRDLCHALNCIPGIQTMESSSGRGERPLGIFFMANDFQGLSFLTRCVDRRYCLHVWKLEMSISDTIHEGFEPISYHLQTEGVGEEAYEAARSLIRNMHWHLNHKNYLKWSGIDPSRFDTLGQDESDWEDQTPHTIPANTSKIAS